MITQQMTQAKVDREVKETIKQIKNKKNKQIHIMIYYASLLLLREFSAGRDFRWREINIAIIDRWSKSGLIRIKEGAWKRMYEA